MVSKNFRTHGLWGSLELRTRRTVPRFSLLLPALLALGLHGSIKPVEGGAQQVGGPEHDGGDGGRRFFFTTLAAFAGPGPANGFERALTLAGYDDTHIWEGKPWASYPRSRREKGGVEFELGYEHSNGLGLAVSAGRTRFGVTSGFKAETDQGEAGDFVHFTYSLRHVSPALMYRLGPVRAFLGPSFVQARSQLNHGLPDSEGTETTKVGVAAGIGLSANLLLPVLNLEFRARYRFVGDPEMGPFARPEQDIPAFKTNFNHWQAGIGLALHLQTKGSAQTRTQAPFVQSDSVSDAGMMAGRVAARARSTLGYTAGSFLGGLPIGIWSLCADQSDCLSFTLGGVAIIGADAVVARLMSNRVPKSLADQLEDKDPRYKEAFGSAYRAELRGRQRKAIVRGGLTGTVVGLGLILLLLGGSST